MVFVTVGTTQFDSLIATLDDPACIAALKSHGFTSVRIQLGRGSVVPTNIGAIPAPEPSAGSKFTFPVAAEPGIVAVDYYRVKPSAELWADVDHASLVISHAGAGSIVEALQRRKPLVVVVNDALMGNHQTEVADALAEMNHLVVCSGPSSLQQVRTFVDLCLISVHVLTRSKVGRQRQ
jgi:beta-1,4-N-acetylglucosaminyltransferase